MVGIIGYCLDQRMYLMDMFWHIFVFMGQGCQSNLVIVGMLRHKSLLSCPQIYPVDIFLCISMSIDLQSIQVGNQFHTYSLTHLQMYQVDNFRHKLCHFDEQKVKAHRDISEHISL